MMKKYLEMTKSYKEEFTTKEILSAIYGAFVFTLLIALPALAAIGQIISVYLYYLTFWVVLLIIVMILLNMLFHHFLKKALVLKKSEIKTDLNTLFLIDQIIIDIIFVIIGFLFIFVFIPILMV